MSYPPAKYDGDTGLVNARLRPAGAAPEVRYKNGGTAEYLALWAKSRGHETWFYWYVTACVATSLAVYVTMPETREREVG